MVRGAWQAPVHGVTRVRQDLATRPPGESWVGVFIFLNFYKHIFLFLFNFYFYFILLYNTVLVLPYIDMSPPRVYMRSQT